jgi:hypothetical protein
MNSCTKVGTNRQRAPIQQAVTASSSSPLRTQNDSGLHLAYPPVHIPWPWTSSIQQHDLSSLGQWNAGGHRYIKPATAAKDTVRGDMELCFDGLYLCMDIRASECASARTGWTDGKGEVDVLDDSGA